MAIASPTGGVPRERQDGRRDSLTNMLGSLEHGGRAPRADRTARVVRALALALAAAALLAGCTAIRDRRGYVADEALLASVQPGVDNRRSVEGTLGRPTFTSQFGPPIWYYVSSVSSRSPFGRPEFTSHSVLHVHFDPAGNVASVERTGLDKVVSISPDGDETPTLGRERGFFQDLFGNIGAVGVPGAGAGAGGPGPNGS